MVRGTKFCLDKGALDYIDVNAFILDSLLDDSDTQMGVLNREMFMHYAVGTMEYHRVSYHEIRQPSLIPIDKFGRLLKLTLGVEIQTVEIDYHLIDIHKLPRPLLLEKQLLVGPEVGVDSSDIISAALMLAEDVGIYDYVRPVGRGDDFVISNGVVTTFPCRGRTIRTAFMEVNRFLFTVMGNSMRPYALRVVLSGESYTMEKGIEDATWFAT